MNTVIAIFQLIPSLIVAMKAVEEAIPGNGAGEQKLALIRGILETADGAVAGLWPKIKPVIDMLVAAFNSAGIFKK